METFVPAQPLCDLHLHAILQLALVGSEDILSAMIFTHLQVTKPLSKNVNYISLVN